MFNQKNQQPKSNGIIKSVFGTLAAPGSGGNARNHSVNTLNWLKPDSQAFTPENPGDMTNYSSREILQNIPKSISTEEADAAVVAAAGQEHFKDNLSRYLKALGKQVVADAGIQEAWRGYQTRVAAATLRKTKSNASYNNALQGIRVGYMQLGVSAYKAGRKANNRIDELKARYLGGGQDQQ